MTEFPPPANNPAEDAGPGASPTEIDARLLQGGIGPSAPTELETIYATAPVGLAVLDRDLRFVRVNERFAAITGAAVVAQRKDEFLATLAHELRNPLAPLRTCLKILEHETMSDHGGRAVAMGTRQVLQLARLVDDLLEVARITRGKISLRIERVLLQQVLYTVVEAVSATFEANGQRLVVDLPQDSVWIDADAIRLGQIVENLLSNASKYTGREGVVTLRARRLDDEVAIEG
jgi:signal transduction histidine kinase